MCGERDPIANGVRKLIYNKMKMEYKPCLTRKVLYNIY